MRYNIEYFTYHVCNLIFFPSNSIVLILKSIPVISFLFFCFCERQRENKINGRLKIRMTFAKKKKKTNSLSMCVYDVCESRANQPNKKSTELGSVTMPLISISEILTKKSQLKRFHGILFIHPNRLHTFCDH